MTLTKEKNNTHKQRTLPNDERPVKGSNGHETTNINIMPKMAFGSRALAYAALVRQGLYGKFHLKRFISKSPVTRVSHDERSFKGLHGHETDINGCQKMAFVPYT